MRLRHALLASILCVLFACENSGAANAQTPAPNAPVVKKKKVIIRGQQGTPLYDQFAGQGYGAAGCGLGSIVFGPKPGYIQVFAATLNGIASNQTLGITTGTSNCDIPESAYSVAAYIEVNREILAKDASRGEGETIGNLASILKCKDITAFRDSLRTNFDSIFKTENNSFDATRVILKEIAHSPALTTTCSVGEG